jgi:hypothetical protein
LAARLQNKARINSILVCKNTYCLNNFTYKFEKEINDIKGFGEITYYHLLSKYGITNNYNYTLNINEYNFRKNILIVDDSDLTVKIMKKKIQMLENVNVDCCNSIDEMVDKLYKYSNK